MLPSPTLVLLLAVSVVVADWMVILGVGKLAFRYHHSQCIPCRFSLEGKEAEFAVASRIYLPFRLRIRFN